jgi:hypothetical protein
VAAKRVVSTDEVDGDLALEHVSSDCPEYSEDRGDTVVHQAVHSGPEMCTACAGQVPHGARWPGV